MPIIGPIISAIPAVLLAATAGLEPVIAALVLYTLVQQLENNLLVPKIQGDAVQMHPGGGHVRDHHRRGARRPPGGDPCPARDRRRLATSCATCSAGSVRSALRRARRTRSRASGLETHPGLPTVAGATATGDELAGVSGPDPYKVLQVDPEAEDEVIAAAYRRLARKYHPDTATGAEASGRMEAINAAWEVLGDPKRRAAYDRERARPGGRMARRGAGGAAAAGRRAPRPRSSAAQARARPRPVRARRRRAPEPETVSRDWSSGRSSVGGGYDPSMRTPDGTGAAGQPPGNPSGSVMNFGRYAGWSLGEISRSDLEYLEWLDRMPIGRPYREEIDAILRQAGRRRSAEADKRDRRGLFRRR